ncbi:MAG TPA: HAD hydrolase family protein [Candidatus Polarisedimenticolaceae bacterium]|nr:HAD hydrolase family protein [Candidatus Polarisedimenticolaceae bacterium]
MTIESNAPTSEVVDRARKIRLVLFDSDGTLTDGRIIMTSGGEEARAFDVRDGHGVRMGQQAGLVFGVISGRESTVLQRRAEELEFEEIHQRVLDKEQRLKEILERRGLDASAVCFMGDDLIDLPVMRRCGLAVAPADAVAEVLDCAHHVTRRPGGRGAARELIDLLLRVSGSWERVTARYFGEP